jgi:transposase
LSVASSTRIRFAVMWVPQAAVTVMAAVREVLMLKQTEETEEIIARVAGLDIGKADVMCCVRVPDLAHAGRRLQEVVEYTTMTRSLMVLSDRLAELGVTRVVMEATSDYWKPVFYVLEAAGFEVWLVNARDVKHLPGRPKTDKLDAVWLCKVAERQMLRPSFVPPPRIRRLRDYTRYRAALVVSRGAEKQRVEKLLEDACIKLSVVASNIFGVSGRQMMAALIAGERDPQVLASMAHGRMLRKTAALREAFTGFFTDHHAFLLARMLERIDTITADIDAIETQVEGLIAPFEEATAAIHRLCEIPGVGVVAARALVAEMGLDMSRFPTPAHLASWAGFAPGVSESAGKRKGNGKTRHGNRYLAGTVGEIAIAQARLDTFLGERYRRIRARRGPKIALVAVGHSILIVIWHLLSDPDAHFVDLGSGFHATHIDRERRIRNHQHQLEVLGFTVTLEPLEARA